MGELHRDQRRVFQEGFGLAARLALEHDGGLSQETRQPVVLSEASKIYDGGVRALDGVSLAVARGEFVALQGPSGCGKSTLLALAGCIDLPTSGEVRIEGKATSSLSDDELTRLRRDRIGTIFQFFNLLPTLSLEQNVALPLTLQHRTRDEIAARTARALEAVGIMGKARSLPGDASGGEMQRAAIARAIVHEPAVVLADEPTGSLDSRNGEIVLEILRRLADSGQTILMATHSDRAAAYAVRRLHLRDGRIDGVT
jgi:putative ABC transport system ATP-binding protein